MNDDRLVVRGIMLFFAVLAISIAVGIHDGVASGFAVFGVILVFLLFIW